jgi:hypothetical protein
MSDDESGSTDTSGTPHLTDGHVRHGLQLVQRYGGRIALGRVTSNSRAPLIAAQLPCITPVIVEAPDSNGTAFDRQRAVERYDARRQLADDDVARRIRLADSASRQFASDASERIRHANTAKRSAICELAARALLFLDSGSSTERTRFLLLATDGGENVAPQRCAGLHSSTVVALIGPPHQAPLFPGLSLRHFENFDDAFAFVEHSLLPARN